MAVVPHIVALPFQMQGHINPLLHLCKKLADLGFSITFVNSESNHVNRFAFSSIPNIKFVAISGGYSGTSTVGKEGARQLVLSSYDMKASFEQLIAGLLEKGILISCILSDTFLGCWTQDVANMFGIPRISFSTGSAAADLLLFFLPRLVQEGHVPVKGPSGHTIKDELIDFIPGMKLKPTDLPSSFFYAGPVIAMLKEAYQRLPEAKYVLSSTFEELEPERVRIIRDTLLKGTNYLPVGPLLPRDKEEMSISDRKCLDWLDTQKPGSVLYVSFGTLATLSAKQVEELGMALEGSGQPFLWALRCDLVENLTEDFLKGFVSRTQTQGLVVSWCPQMRVLAHQSVGGFLSHCGWNSVMESMYAGVPMIGWPCIAEQSFNSKFLVEDYGLAISLWNGKEDRFVEKEEIKEMIEKLMKGEEGKVLREKAMKLKEAAKKSVMEGGSSNANLRRLVVALTTLL